MSRIAAWFSCWASLRGAMTRSATTASDSATNGYLSNTKVCRRDTEGFLCNPEAFLRNEEFLRNQEFPRNEEFPRKNEGSITTGVLPRAACDSTTSIAAGVGVLRNGSRRA
jgi:hypothetical protein